MRSVHRVYRPGLAALSGAVLGLAFPYPGWGFLGSVALVPLVWSIRGAGWRRRALLSALCGAVFFSLLIYWLVYVHPAAGPLLCLWFALWMALFGVIAGSLPTPTAMVLWMPVAWTAVEYLRSIGPLGFAWGLLGHTQWQNPPLLQLASLTGVYGISLLLAMTSGAVAAFPVWCRRRGKRDLAVLLAPMLVIGGVWLWGSGAFRSAEGVGVRSIRLALLQPCFTQQQKWDEGEFERVKVRTYRMTDEAARRGVELIVWPETALPIPLNVLPDYEGELLERLEVWNRPVLVGCLIDHGGETGNDMRNAAILYRPGVSGWSEASRYEKTHLVPWGEYVPLGRYLPFIDRMVTEEGGGGITAGQRATVFDLDEARFGVPICFESAVAGLVRRFVRGGADLIINVTNDAWFRRSSAQDQHLIQSVFRAVENRRPVARAANTGRTCWIAPSGEVRDRLPLYQVDTLVAEIPLASGDTFYSRHGDLFARLMLIVCGGLTASHVIRERRKRSAPVP